MDDDLSSEAIASVTEYANRLIRKDVPIPLLTDGTDFPFISHALEQHFLRLKEANDLRLPDLSLGNETVAIFSDYGGDHDTSKCRTYSFLFANYDAIGPFRDAMTEIRIRHGLADPHKEIAFKDLGYEPLRRSLDDYLRTLNNLVPGFLLTVIVDKDVATLFSDSPTNALEQAGLGTWPRKEAERLLRIIHILTYLATLLAKSGQKLFWMTDDDSIVANLTRKGQVAELFGRLLHHYSNNEYPTIGIATPFSEASYLRDLLSATDLIAGSLEHYYSRLKTDASSKVRDDANKILVWMGYEGVSLRRDAIRIRRSPDDVANRANVATVKFVPTEEATNVVAVPIHP